MTGIHMMLAAAGRQLFSYTAINGAANDNNPTSGQLASSSLTVSRNGTWAAAGNDNNSSGNWATPQLANAGDTHWVRATPTSGAVSSGTTGTWLQLSSAQVWTKSGTTGSGSVTMTIQIATDAAGTNIVSTGSVTIGFSHAPL